MALLQLNLKLPPAVLADWKERAAAKRLSVRDWLLSELAPAAPAAPALDPLADRVAALEAAVAALEAQSPRSLRPPRVAPAAAPASLPLIDPPAAAIETAVLADRLGMRRGTLNARISRAGGACEGLEVEGWRCLGRAIPARGGPPRALWVPAES